VADGGGGVVVTLEETPPHPAQIIVAAKKKDVKTGFMFWPFRTYTRRCLFSGLDASVLFHVAPKASQSRIFKAKYVFFLCDVCFY
jgi:hypothetical protein